MTQRAKQIGNTPLVDSGCDVSSIVPGITYRQWLIGQALANPSIENKTNLEGLINAVEYILELLASEEK